MLHIKVVHDKIKDFVCKLCDLAFANSWNLRDHVKIVHGKIKDETCQICGTAFAMLGVAVLLIMTMLAMNTWSGHETHLLL